MPLEQRDVRLDRGNGQSRPEANRAGEPSIGELFRQLSSDAGRLVRSEVALAKAEFRDAGATLARDGAKIGVAIGLAHLGGIAATVFLILGLGDLLDNYWASALIVTIALFAVAAVMVKSALADIKRRGLKPEKTIETLREDTAWAKREAQDLKRDVTARGNH